MIVVLVLQDVTPKTGVLSAHLTPLLTTFWSAALHQPLIGIHFNSTLHTRNNKVRQCVAIFFITTAVFIDNFNLKLHFRYNISTTL